MYFEPDFRSFAAKRWHSPFVWKPSNHTCSCIRRDRGEEIAVVVKSDTTDIKIQDDYPGQSINGINDE